jgi:hypothetical protein
MAGITEGEKVILRKPEEKDVEERFRFGNYSRVFFDKPNFN